MVETSLLQQGRWEDSHSFESRTHSAEISTLDPETLCLCVATSAPLGKGHIWSQGFPTPKILISPPYSKDPCVGPLILPTPTPASYTHRSRPPTTGPWLAQVISKIAASSGHDEIEE